MANFRIPKDYKKNPKFSVYDLSHDVRSSIKQCLNIPLLSKPMLPGDKFDTSFASKLMSNPLVSPLLGDWTLRFWFFKSDLSNYYGWLDNNTRLDTRTLLSRRKHILTAVPFTSTFFPTNLEGFPWRSSALPYIPNSGAGVDEAGGLEGIALADYGVKPGSLLDFLGVPVGWVCPVPFDGEFSSSFWEQSGMAFVADGVLTYLDAVRSYMVNNQVDYVPYGNKPVYTGAGVDQQMENIVYLDAVDWFFKFLRTLPDGCDFLSVIDMEANNRGLADTFFDDLPESHLKSLGRWFCSIGIDGLFNVQFEPDFFQNLIRNAGDNDIDVITDDNGNFSINQLRFKNKLQRIVDRYDISGGRFSSWLRTIWGTSPSRRMDIPDLIGVTSYDIHTNDIVSTANTAQASGTGSLASGSPTGELSGLINQYNGDRNTDGKRFDYFIDTDVECHLMVIAQLIPQVDYSQGIHPDLSNLLFADDYKPDFDNLSMQDVPYFRYSALYEGMWPTEVLDPSDGNGSLSLRQQLDRQKTIVGREVAFSHLMTEWNKLHGQFSNYGTAGTWVLSRRFAGPGDDFFYAQPGEFQYPFAFTDETQDNFFLQVRFNIRAIRPKGKSYMPTLE